MAKKFTSVNGVTIYVCRKIVKFAFGEANVWDVRCNYPEMQFDIYIKPVDTPGKEKQLAYFKKYWGAGFNVIILSEDKIHTMPSTHGNVPEEQDGEE